MSEIRINLPSENDQGDQFINPNIDDRDEVHEILGFFITSNGGQMYSQVMNHPDGLRYVNKWQWIEYGPVGENVYELLTASNYTVLDMIAHFDRVKGI